MMKKQQTITAAAAEHTHNELDFFFINKNATEHLENSNFSKQ